MVRIRSCGSPVVRAILRYSVESSYTLQNGKKALAVSVSRLCFAGFHVLIGLTDRPAAGAMKTSGLRSPSFHYYHYLRGAINHSVVRFFVVESTHQTQILDLTCVLHIYD
jgi:hypothetical protein